MSLPAEGSQHERQIYTGMKVQKGTAGCTRRISKVQKFIMKASCIAHTLLQIVYLCCLHHKVGKTCMSGILPTCHFHLKMKLVLIFFTVGEFSSSEVM